MATVGLNYQPELQHFISEHASLLDYLELVPDIAWTDRGEGCDPRYVDDRDAVSFLTQIRLDLPFVAHSIGLSIGSAHRFRLEHVEQIASWDDRFDFLWHSDHLGYNLVLDQHGVEHTVGVPLPVPLDQEMLDLVVERIGRVKAMVSKRFLLENNSSFVRFSSDEFSEAEFLNHMCAITGCGLLLDLHNLYVNAVNQMEDLRLFMDAIDLDNVVEIHLAGGLSYDGYYLDAHSGEVPTELWEIAADVVPACTNLRGVTFELLGSWYDLMGPEAVVDTLGQIRDLS